MNSTKMELDLNFSRVLLERDIKTSKVANSKIAESTSHIYLKRCFSVKRKLEVVRIQRIYLPSSSSKDFSAWPAIKSSTIGRRNSICSFQFLSHQRLSKEHQLTWMPAFKPTLLMVQLMT